MKTGTLRPLLLPLLCLSLASACGKAAPESATLEKLAPTHPVLTPLPDPDGQSGHVGRAPRRLTVAQLDKAIIAATGRQWDDLDDLAPTLGQADYSLINTENTEPNLVFAKFLDDGARKVCLQVSAADQLKPAAADRVLSRKIDSVADVTAIPAEQARANLVYLSTRFWGQPLGGEELAAYEKLFTDVATRAKAANKKDQAFAAMCIAMMTDSRFVSY